MGSSLFCCLDCDFRVVEDAANPFAKVLELYREIVGSEEDLLPKSSTLQIFHSVTFSEIMASSFLDEDKLPGSSKLDTQLPFRKTVCSSFWAFLNFSFSFSLPPHYSYTYG